jgi:hypothetical protein
MYSLLTLSSCFRDTVLSAIPVGSPQFPGSNTACAQALQLLFVLERVHARPETIEFVADQLLSSISL